MINKNNTNMLPGGALSLGANARTTWFSVLPGTIITIQAAWSGTPIGNFSLLVSNDEITPNPDMSLPTAPTNFNTYTGTTVAAGGGTGVFTWQVPAGYAHVALDYASSSSTGSLTSAQLVTKG